MPDFRRSSAAKGSLAGDPQLVSGTGTTLVVDGLDTVDEAIDATQDMLTKQEKIKDGLLQDLLTRGVDKNGKLRPPHTQAPELYKQSPLGMIPKEWKIRAIADIGHVVTGYTPPSNDPQAWGDYMPFITPTEVIDSGEVIRPERCISFKGMKYVRTLPRNSIVVVCIGSRTDITGQGREHWRDVLLKERLSAAIKRINKNPDGDEWLDKPRLNHAIKDLDILRSATGQNLMERNQAATKLILEGTVVDGVEGWDQGKNRRIRYIDWANPENNEFLIINQFRVDEPIGQQHDYILPDLVLFVNGIPLVVIECKSPAVTNPIESAINQLLRYSNQRHWIDEDEGNEKLLYNISRCLWLLMVVRLKLLRVISNIALL